jgi:hypothetical protein
MQGVREADLETVVSKKAGTALMIVRGKLCGEHARLLEKGKREATVQLAESREVLQMDLDDVADYRAGADEDHW